MVVLSLELKKHIEGDLLELDAQRLDKGMKRANLKSIIDVLLLFRPGIIRPLRNSNTLNQYIMFNNYFKVGIRNILKYKMFSFINVFGLALAMSVCMLIILMLADQKSYDQFHTKKERIYRTLTDKPNARLLSAVTSFPLSNALKADYPAVEEATRLKLGVGGDATYKAKSIALRGYFADVGFFNVFDYELEKGNVLNALTSPNSMVITRRIANELFGDENPLGKNIHFTDRGLDILNDRESETTSTDWGRFTITGIMAENFKSHLKFDVLVSSSSMPDRKVLRSIL